MMVGFILGLLTGGLVAVLAVACAKVGGGDE